MPISCALCVISAAKFDSVPPIFSATATATSLAERVTIALIASSTLIDSPGGDAELRGLLVRRVLGDRDPRRQAQRAFVELLEQHIERHHLGERRGVAQRVLVDAPDLAAGVGVDDDRRILVGLDLGGDAGGEMRGRPGAGDVMVAVVEVVAPVRLGRSASAREDRHRGAKAGGARRQTENTLTPLTAHHDAPLTLAQRRRPKAAALQNAHSQGAYGIAVTPRLMESPPFAPVAT